VELRVVLKTCSLLVFELVLLKSCLFFADFCFADSFFYNFYATFAASLHCIANFGRVLSNLLVLDLLFGFERAEIAGHLINVVYF